MTIDPEEHATVYASLRRIVLGCPKPIHDPRLFHKLSLIPILAWVGLGADGLSSSSYGPEEAFRALGNHTYLALLLGGATALTVFIISFAYSRIIEKFPHGGGGYIVATHMLGEEAGVVSGSALLVDYILTITVSVASCGDAIFSYLPPELLKLKVAFSCTLIMMLVILNLRGVKESIAVLTPIFIVFIVSHATMLLNGVFSHSSKFAPLAAHFQSSMREDLSGIGAFGILAILLRAYSLGGGTYTGIEAVSNGLQIMREPHVQNGKRTMLYMALSLAFTAGILFVLYPLLGIKPVEGRTLNAVLADALFLGWPMGGWIAFITIFSEGCLLVIAAQAGFVDGPRVMANMAIDSWFPHRFAALSERLTMQNGILIMGGAAIALLVYTDGSVSALVVMYSINVFLTFSLSQLGMSRFYLKHRRNEKKWKSRLAVHLVGLLLCLTILGVTVFEKFMEGGWITLLTTSFVVALCFAIRKHYRKVKENTAQLDEMLLNVSTLGKPNGGPLGKNEMTAVQLVTGYSGFGVHTFLSILRNFPHLYKNFIFVSVAVIDSGVFKGEKEIATLEASIQESLQKYVDLARRFGFPAEYRMVVATEVVDKVVDICEEVCDEFHRSTIFAGQLSFSFEKIYHRVLHNETAFAIQRRLHWCGIPMVILPIRVQN